MTQKSLGNITIVAIALLNIVLWVLFPPPDRLETNYVLQFVGEVIASTVMILIAIGLVLAARPRFLEPYFGGLDKMFHTHKRLSMLAFILLIVHFFSIPKTENFLNGKPLGMIAFLGMVILVLLTVAPRVPLISRFFKLNYTKWRIAHKLLGIFFIVGLAHYLLVDTISQRTIPGAYMLLWSGIGIIAFIYRQFFSRMFEPYRNYTVEQVNRLTGTILELHLKPSGKPVSYQAGQFVYLYFKGPHGLREPHPFTVSSAPSELTLRLTIKASGDWTRRLYDKLEPGVKAAVHGGFGMFDYKGGGKEQIWIAGGIGVTPFLSWIRDFGDKPETEIDFFYGVGSKDEAVFLDEFEAMAGTNHNFRTNARFSVEDGHLSAEQIAEQSQGSMSDKHIYMCGPIGMMEGFAARFKAMGVPAHHIHYEEFNLR